MDGKEEIRLAFIRDRGALTKGNKRVIGTRENNFRSHLLLDQFGEAHRDVKHHIFFKNAMRPDGAIVVAAMPRIYHYPVDLESQGPRERTGCFFGRERNAFGRRSRRRGRRWWSDRRRSDKC